MSSSSRLMPRTRLSRGIVVSWDRATATGYAEVAGIGSVPIDGCKEVLAKGDMIRLALGTSARGLVGLRPCKVDAGLAKPSSVRLRPRPLLVQPSFASADAAAHLLEPPVDEEQLGHLAACRARHAALRSRDSYLWKPCPSTRRSSCALSALSTRPAPTDLGSSCPPAGDSRRCSSSCSRGRRRSPSRRKGCARHTRRSSQEGAPSGPEPCALAARVSSRRQRSWRACSTNSSLRWDAWSRGPTSLLLQRLAGQVTLQPPTRAATVPRADSSPAAPCRLHAACAPSLCGRQRPTGKRPRECHACSWRAAICRRSRSNSSAARRVPTRSSHRPFTRWGHAFLCGSGSGECGR
jgi:hypothetical protein